MNKRLLFTILPVIFCVGCSSNTKSDDVTKYNELLDEYRSNNDFHTELYIFPENINQGTPLAFLSQSQDGLFSGSYAFYLVMSYEQTAFDVEIDRISQVKGVFGQEAMKNIIHFEEESLYLTISQNGRYEYAMYDADELTIAYVSNQLFSWSTSGIKKEHQLPNITIPKELEDDKNAYNMYYLYRMENGIKVGYYVQE